MNTVPHLGRVYLDSLADSSLATSFFARRLVGDIFTYDGDCGFDYHSVKKLAGFHGVEVEYCPPRTEEYKRHGCFTCRVASIGFTQKEKIMKTKRQTVADLKDKKNKEARDAFDKLVRRQGEDMRGSNNAFDEYVHELTPQYSVGDVLVFISPDVGPEFVFVKDQLVYACDTVYPDGGYSKPACDLKVEDVIKLASGVEKDEVPSGLILSTKRRTEGNEAYKVLMLLNGDENSDSEGPEHSFVNDFEGMPVCSFSCLGRFYNKPGEALRRLSNGKLKVVDFTSDVRIPLDKKNRKKAPAPGFTKVGSSWHRSGTTLLQDDEKEMCLLLGQDEGTYFGVELPKMVNSIDAAFKVLTPKEVLGKDYVRQGEWFMIKVPANEVPLHKDCILEFRDEVILARDSDESNEHCLYGQGRVGKDGRVYVNNGRVDHNEHAQIQMDGWATFYKNTAVRAFSQEGVD